MEGVRDAIARARQILIECMERFRDDPTDERLEELQAAIDDWMGAVKKARN